MQIATDSTVSGEEDRDISDIFKRWGGLGDGGALTGCTILLSISQVKLHLFINWMTNFNNFGCDGGG